MQELEAYAMRPLNVAMRNIFLFACLTLTTLANENSNTSAVSNALAHAKCASQVIELLKNWHSADEWIGGVENLDGGQNYRTPTDSIGTWIELTVYPDDTVEASRASIDATLTATWEFSCTAVLKLKKHRPELLPTHGFFTDVDLQDFINKNNSGIVYAWSPHMPYSVRGLPEARELARKLKIGFVAVLDPEASDQLTAQVAKKHHIEQDDLRRYSSIELEARGMSLHFPSLLVFKEKKFRGPMLPGYWDEVSALERHVKKRLSE